MELTLTRNASGKDGIFGTLNDGAELSIRTLEHAYEYPPLPGYKPKLPAGTYTCVRGQHVLAGMHNPFETFEVTGVIGHSGILFHVGNWNRDSAGCILVGVGTLQGEQGRMLTLSKAAFQELMGALASVNVFTLHVVDEPKLSTQAA